MCELRETDCRIAMAGPRGSEVRPAFSGPGWGVVNMKCNVSVVMMAALSCALRHHMGPTQIIHSSLASPRMESLSG